MFDVVFAIDHVILSMYGFSFVAHVGLFGWFVWCDFLYCIEGYSIAGSCWLVICPNECDWLVVHFTLFTMGEPIVLENAW